MSQGFFSIRDHRDMLAKAERELARMEATPGVDNVFNFFVTAYHVMDYIRTLPSITKAATDAMYADLDFQMCQFICNKGKHMELRSGDKEASLRADRSGTFGGSPFGSVPFAAGQPIFVVDGRKVDVRQLGREIIAKWKAFFTDNGI